jgi:hypothetical protein
MLLSRLATGVLLAFMTALFLQMPSVRSTERSVGQAAERGALGDVRPSNCRVTLPSDGVFEPPTPSDFVGPSRTPNQFLFGTEKLWTVLPADGTWRGPVPSQAGDFVYSSKLPWFRTEAGFPKDGFTVRGKRLDGPGPSFVETFDGIIFSGKKGNAMIMGGISIPVFGCWEITGHYEDEELSFTIWVASRPGQEPYSRTDAPLMASVPPVPSAGIRRVHVDSETEAKSLVYRVLPEIPQGATASGTVVLHAIIGTDGRPRELSYISGPPLLVQAAREAVVWWQYRIDVVSLEPYEPEEVDTAIPVLFDSR